MLTRAIEGLITLPFAAPGALVFVNPETDEPTQLAILALEHHRGIVDAIANREGTRAEALAREHARIARRNLNSVLTDRDLFNRIPGASLVRLPVPIGAL